MSMKTPKFIGEAGHVWTEDGIFNINGAVNTSANYLNAQKDPEIWDCIRFGSILENVEFYEDTRDTNYDDTSITMNSRLQFPNYHVPSAVLPSMGGHAKNVIFLMNDTMGVMPLVSKLT